MNLHLHNEQDGQMVSLQLCDGTTINSENMTFGPALANFKTGLDPLSREVFALEQLIAVCKAGLHAKRDHLLVTTPGELGNCIYTDPKPEESEVVAEIPDWERLTRDSAIDTLLKPLVHLTQQRDVPEAGLGVFVYVSVKHTNQMLRNPSAWGSNIAANVAAGIFFGHLAQFDAPNTRIVAQPFAPDPTMVIGKVVAAINNAANLTRDMVWERLIHPVDKFLLGPVEKKSHFHLVVSRKHSKEILKFERAEVGVEHQDKILSPEPQVGNFLGFPATFNGKLTQILYTP